MSFRRIAQESVQPKWRSRGRKNPENDTADHVWESGWSPADGGAEGNGTDTQEGTIAVSRD